MATKVVVYTRVSTEEQKLHGFSLIVQLNSIEKYCAQYGYEIIKHYQEDYSAKNFDRPEFTKFLTDLKTRKIRPDLIIVTKIDRFSRNVFLTYGMVQELNSYKVKVYSIAEGHIDFSTTASFFPMLIQAGAAQHDNIQRAENTNKGMREAMRQGRWVWRAPHGYRNDTNLKLIVPDPDKAHLVKEAFDLMASGKYSADYVRKMMYKKGLKTAKTTFSNLLKNVLYIGKIWIKSNEQLNEPEIIVNGAHEPLIDEIVFQKVQDVLSGRHKKFPASQTQNINLPLRGYLMCNTCGKVLTGSRSKSRSGRHYYYYHCQNDCKERFRADFANEQFMAYLHSFQVPVEVISLYNRILEDIFNREDGKRTSRIKQLESEIERQKTRLNILLDKFIDGNIDPKSYNATRERYEAVLKQNEAEHGQLTTAKSTYFKYVKFGFTLLSNISEFYKNAALSTKQQIVGSIFPEKLVFDKLNYRTTKLNKLFTLNELVQNGLGENKNRKANKTVDFSIGALPSGLEPETL